VAKGLTLEARDITVSRRGKAILDRVSFCVRPHTLTAIIGPNGAGKTTLMRALAGELPDGGQVLINGQDIYREPEYWLQKIGYVPVDNILHGHLTLQEALQYIGRLRLRDLPFAVIRAKVDRLLTRFGFPPDDDRRRKQIRDLSTGELKRANVCSELIIDPDILMLDEPTSNLDPNAEQNLMQLLASYAHEQRKTILVITHTLNTIGFCDEVIFIENSRLHALGEPERVLEQLETELGLKSNPVSFERPFIRWARVFEETRTQPEIRRDYVKNRRPGASRGRVSTRMSVATSWLAQFRYLISRYMRVRLGDRRNLIVTLLAGLSGILFFALPGKAFVAPYDLSERAFALNQARESIYVIALVVTLLGMITSYTEISKEFRIFSHERLKGLSPSAYFLSKWLWLTLAVGVLAPILLLGFLILVYQQPLPDFPKPGFGATVGWWERLIHYQLAGTFNGRVSWLILGSLILSCITSVTIGLLISTIAGDGGKANLYLNFVAVFVVLFSGLIRNPKLGNLIDKLSIFSTGKWAYEGIASGLSLYCWTDSWRFDEFNSTGHVISIWISLTVFTLAAIFLSICFLHLRDPWHRGFTSLRLLFTRNKTRFVVLLSVLILLFSYAVFLRDLSHEYHSLNYWSREEYGGDSAYQYANIESTLSPNIIQYWGGKLSQSWCGDQ
jgi:ABC-type multidrug transport system ATPase subunit